MPEYTHDYADKCPKCGRAFDVMYQSGGRMFCRDHAEERGLKDVPPRKPVEVKVEDEDEEEKEDALIVDNPDDGVVG